MQFRCLLRRQFLLGQIDALGDEAVPSVVSDARQLPLAQIPERESRALRACSRSSVPDRAGSFSTKCGRSPRGSALSTRSEPQSTVSQCIEQRAAPDRLPPRFRERRCSELYPVRHRASVPGRMRAAVVFLPDAQPREIRAFPEVPKLYAQPSRTAFTLSGSGLRACVGSRPCPPGLLSPSRGGA